MEEGGGDGDDGKDMDGSRPSRFTESVVIDYRFTEWFDTMKLREFTRYVSGEKIVEIFLEPRKSCRYYWKSLITTERTGEFMVRFYNRFGESYRENVIFDDLDDAKIYVRRTLLNQ